MVTCLSLCKIKGALFVHFPKRIKLIKLFEYYMTCKQAYIQTEPFLFTVQLTGNYVSGLWEALLSQGERTTRVCSSRRLTRRQRQKAKKIPSAHYGTNNPSHVWGMAEPTGRLPSQPVDLWQRPKVRLRGEFLPSLRGGNFADVATSHCQEKIPLKKERNNRDQTDEIKSLSYLHILAEDQPLVRCVLLHKGQQEVGGLLPSPLITLNDCNGHTFEIKSTYSHAHMHMHMRTGHSHTDLALHSATVTATPASVSEWLIAVGKRQTSGLLRLFLFSVQSAYSREITCEFIYRDSNLVQVKLKSLDMKSDVLLSTFPCTFCDATMMLLQQIKVVLTWRQNFIPIFWKLFSHPSDEEPTESFLEGKGWPTNGANLQHVTFKADQSRFWHVADAKWSMDDSDLPAPPWLVHSCPGEMLPMTLRMHAHLRQENNQTLF